MNSKYRKMLRLMQEKEKKSPLVLKSDEWFLYILKCKDGSLYTGITKDIERRFKMHKKGIASRYTRTRLPVKLLYRELCGSRTQALVRECAVKSFSRRKKLALLQS